MPVSKLELLPNELLLDLFEHYMNPVDVFVAFANQLNARFTALVRRCRAFRLDLTTIQKKEFNRFLKSISNHCGQIESLSISDHLPGQIDAFQKYFPTFNQFRCLSELNLYFHKTSNDINYLSLALDSLSSIPIHRLSIKGVGSHASRYLVSEYRKIFHHQTIRRLVLEIDQFTSFGNLTYLGKCDIEYLTLLGGSLSQITFQRILSCATELIYLNIQVKNYEYRIYRIKRDQHRRVERTAKLRTLIFNCKGEHDQSTLISTLSLLKNMSNLRRLTITSDRSEQMDGIFSKEFFETSLPLLTHFTLIVYSEYSWIQFSDEALIQSFQTPFWIKQRNFNIYKAIHERNNHMSDYFCYYPILDPYRTNLSLESATDSQFIWSLPSRVIETNSSRLNFLTALRITQSFSSSTMECKLNNIKILRIDAIDSPLLHWINQYIDLNKVIQLDVHSVRDKFHLIISLISQMKNLNDLIINDSICTISRELVTDKIVQFIPISRSVRRLDIFSYFTDHPFERKHIRCLAFCFPLLEHLRICTRDLQNVPFLNKYFPKLITLTFKIDSDLIFNHDYLNQWEKQFRSKVKFQYRRKSNYITIWVDHNALNDHFWYSPSIVRPQLKRGRKTLRLPSLPNRRS